MAVSEADGENSLHVTQQKKHNWKQKAQKQWFQQCWWLQGEELNLWVPSNVHATTGQTSQLCLSNIVKPIASDQMHKYYLYMY